MSVFSNPSNSTPDETAQYVAALLGLVEGRHPLDILRETPAALAVVPARFGAGLHTPEAPGKWSANMVLQHLADSELVFGWRVRLVLAHERPTLTGYDQDRWADRLHYAEGDPEEAIARFSLLRSSNLRIIGRATPADMARVAIHAERGEESLAHILRLYAGHDVLHLRQLERVLAMVANA